MFFPEAFQESKKQTEQPNQKSTINNINDYSTKKKLNKSNMI